MWITGGWHKDGRSGLTSPQFSEPRQDTEVSTVLPITNTLYVNWILATRIHVVPITNQAAQYRNQYHTNPKNNMPFFWSKGVGGRHFGTSVHAGRDGVHRGPWRFSFGKFNCFKAH
ncbi:hypothetical protein PG987_009485 [Apiospora arundinis]